MKIQAEEGSLVTLVFKAAPFAPAPDPATNQISMQLNFFKGVFRGYAPPSGSGPSTTFKLESYGEERSIMWFIEDTEIAMWCEIGRVEVASTVS